MTIKIRCADCRKRISVDQGFAGGMCRCPYCKAIVLVPESAAKRGGTGLSGLAGSGLLRRSSPEPLSRPDSPGARPSSPGSSGLRHAANKPRPIVSTKSPKRPSRPAQTKISNLASPKISSRHARKSAGTVYETTKVDMSQLSDDQLASIPMASPVKLQGIAVIVMLAAIVLMLVTSVIIMIQLSGGDDVPVGPGSTGGSGEPSERLKVFDDGYSEINPYVVGSTLTFAGTIPLKAPVIYCVDGGGAMRPQYDMSMAMVRLSAITTVQRKMGIILAREGEPEQIVPLRPRGRADLSKIRKRVSREIEGGTLKLEGRSDVPTAIRKALTYKPKTLVLFPGPREIVDAKALGEEIKKAGCTLILITYDEKLETVNATWTALLKAAGPSSHHLFYRENTITDFYNDYCAAGSKRG